MKSKSKSIIVSFIIVITTLIFIVLSIISIMTPNLAKEIKKDLSKGVASLCSGNIKDYYNIYNTRKLTEIDKTKFYEKISSTQEIINSEQELFKKYKLNIQIKDVSIIDKIGDNLFLCNITVNHKSRKNDKTTDVINKTEDYILKIIDVGNMDYKILLPFNSMDKDFSSSNIYKALEESALKKQAEKIKEQRELKEKAKAEQQKLEEEINKEKDKEKEENNAQIIENSSDIDLNTSDSDNSITQNNDNEINNNQNEISSEKKENNSNNEDSNKSAYESFLEN